MENLEFDFASNLQEDYMYEEQYDYSPLEELKDEFIRNVFNNVNDSLKAILKRRANELIESKKEAQDWRAKYFEIKNKSEGIVREYETKIANIESEWQYGKISLILDKLTDDTLCYILSPYSIKKPKCDKCDDNYKIHGEIEGYKVSVSCKCLSSVTQYRVITALLIPKSVRERRGAYMSDRGFNYNYDVIQLTQTESECRFELYKRDLKTEFNETDPSKINTYNVGYINKEDAEKACAMLNEYHLNKE